MELTIVRCIMMERGYHGIMMSSNGLKRCPCQVKKYVLKNIKFGRL